MGIARRVASFGFAVFLWSSATHAGTFAVFGPRDYTRATGEPQTIRETFTIQHAAVPYKLRLINGGAAGTFGKVTSAIVMINGIEIFGAKDFKPSAPVTLEKIVPLTPTNEISVEVRGAPGDGMTISVIGEDMEGPAITPTVTPSPNAAAWNNTPVTVSFSCTDAISVVTSCSPPVTLTDATSGQTVIGRAVDGASNESTTSVVVKIDTTGPLGTVVEPTPNELVPNGVLTVRGTTSDALSGVARVTCNGTNATLAGGNFECEVSIIADQTFIDVRPIDAAGNESSILVAVTRDETPPTITISAPAAASTTNAASAKVTGRVDDDYGVASVRVNGAVVPLANGAFETDVALAEGPNTITVSATDKASNATTQAVAVSRLTLPSVSISQPQDLGVVTAASVTVSGTATAGTTVTVNGVDASVSGTSFTAAGVPLAQGRSVITATARTPAGNVATDSIHIFRDGIPPRLVIDHPADGETVVESTITVSGMVDDIVVGTVNSAQARVTVKGIAATVANRSFAAHNVPLTAGLNTIVVTAEDAGGNTTSTTLHVTYDAAAQPKIAAASGDNQSAPIGTLLAQPVVVRLTDAAGNPAPNRTVAFEVIENNGTLSANGAGGRTISVATGADGRATAAWTLGMRAGSGNQVVEARAVGFAGVARFVANGTTRPAHHVVVDSGDNQFGIAGELAPRPLVAVVVDEGSNRLAGVPVTFSAAAGGITFDGAQTSATVMTDSDGRAIVTPRLGPGAGANSVRARVAGVESIAVFRIKGRIAGRPEDTVISGVILDNTDVPIAGVTVRIDGTAVAVRSNAQGHFTIPSAPVGYVKLLVDGSTTERPGTWPTLEFAMYTLPGTNNTIGMPIYLLPIDVTRGLFVDEVTGGTLTLPEVPGFALAVKPGSVTFPGGGRTGTISVTTVHSDKMPMPPGFGQQPRFIVTIQPAGAHFDPPAQITFPNIDGLQPGQITELYSFDHDLGQFVSIGTGTVSADGTVLESDPGVGIMKAGWHCGGDPAANGSVADCPKCKRCLDGECETDLFKDCKCEKNSVCVNGSPVPVGGPLCGPNNPVVPASLVSNATTAVDCLAPQGFVRLGATTLVTPSPDPTFSACKDNCVARFRVGPYNYPVRSGTCPNNRTNVNSAYDGVVSATTYCAIISDFSVFVPGTSNPIQSQYSSSDAVMKHEMGHVKQWNAILQGFFAQLEQSVEGQTATFDCSLMNTGAAVDQKRQSFINQFLNGLNAARTQWQNLPESGAESEALPTYQAIAAAVCLRARGEGWAASNPCTACPP